MVCLLRVACTEGSEKQIMTVPVLKTTLQNWRGYKEEL